MTVTPINSNPIPFEATPTIEKTHLRPRRTLNRLALALAGVAAGVLGQILFGQGSLWDGLLLYGVAVILFTRALADHPYRPSPDLVPLPPQPLTANLHSGWRRMVGVWLMVLAVAISYLSFRFFSQEDAQLQAWWLYLVSLVLFVGGGLLLTKGNSWRIALQEALPHRYVAIGLAAIVGLALFMRLYNFGSQPFGIWYDEAEAGLQARRMLQEPAYRPVFYASINVTGHLLAIYALALHWLGDTIESMRLVSVLFGVGTVLAAYLFGRELRGPRFGLALAFLVAVARWHINFSRIAMTGIDTPFFEFLSLFFLVRLLRRGQLRDALWAGLSLGFGLMFYTAFRLYLVTLLIFMVIGAICWWRRLAPTFSHKGWLAHLGRFGLMIVAIWLVMMPVVKFALADSEAFWYRTRQISIFTRRDQADLTLALGESASKHLLMFNYKGDNNGRHNLPGEPMLDPVMGVLAVLGLGLALVRARYPANAFFLMLLPITLAGGIFSVDFEAPQSLRSIAVMPAVIYFAGLALVALGREAEQALQPLPRLWLFGPAAFLAGLLLFFNGFTYFVRQANDFASWNAFSAPETITGHKMAELGPTYLYFLSPFLANHPTLRFLAPEVVEQRTLLLPDALPIREPADRPVAIFLHPDEAWVFDEAQRLYPNANFETAYGPAEADPPVVYFVNLQPTDLAAVQGLELRYEQTTLADEPADQSEETAAPVILYTGRTFKVDLTWPDDAPPNLPDLSQGKISTTGERARAGVVAEWSGVLYAPRYGPYSFRLVTPGPGLLELDGNIVLEGQGERLTGLPLAQGNHSFRVRAEVAPGEVALFWQPPGQGQTLVPQWALYVPPITNHGLLGSFYANDRWEGQPALQRIDPFLDTYFHFTPLNRPYTVEWTGSLDVSQSGAYRLGLRAVQEAQLYLDGQLLVTTLAPNEYTETPAVLEAGLHDLRVRYKDSTDRSRIHLYWTPPTGSVEPIPSQNLWPPLGRYPEPPATLAETTIETAPLTLTWVATLGSPGSELGQFLEPRDIAVLADGSLVVADTVNRRVQLLTPQGAPLQALTGNEFPFEEPLAVGVNSRNEILVLDSTLQWIYRYDAAGNLIDRFGGPTAFLFHPRGMTVFEDDRIALADTGSARLALFSPDGVQAGSIGGLGNGPGQFNEPTDVLRDAQGTYFVAEAENDRIQRVDASGNPLGQWAILPAYAYNGPHLAFGPDGSLFMTEAQSNSLLRYAPNGDLLDQWQAVGPVNLASPVGIYFDVKTNRLYVTDIRTHQIHVFAVEVINQ